MSISGTNLPAHVRAFLAERWPEGATLETIITTLVGDVQRMEGQQEERGGRPLATEHARELHELIQPVVDAWNSGLESGTLDGALDALAEMADQYATLDPRAAGEARER
jgi:hypothetical protein